MTAKAILAEDGKTSRPKSTLFALALEVWAARAGANMQAKAIEAKVRGFVINVLPFITPMYKAHAPR